MPIEYAKAPSPTSFRLEPEIMRRLRMQAAKENRDVTSLVKILLIAALDVREVSIIKESSRIKKRLLKRHARTHEKKGGSHASVLD